MQPIDGLMGRFKWFFFLGMSAWGAAVFFAPSIRSYLKERYPDEFHLDKVACDVEAELPPCSPGQLPPIFHRPFYYLGHGYQAIAFESEDGKYVLKFFLKKNLHGKRKHPIPKPTHWIPSHRKARRDHQHQADRRDLLKTLRNYSIAFQKIPDLTGIVYLHLLPTQENLPEVLFYDQAGREFTLPLDRASFVIQLRGDLVMDRLNKASTIEEKQQVLNALEACFMKMEQAGFVDRERHFQLERNYGLVGKNPMLIDLGKIEYVGESVSLLYEQFCQWVEERVSDVPFTPIQR